MFIVGITGGTGAGKTSVLRALKTLGALALDCDAIYHELLADNENLKTELEARFAGITKDGKIDRKTLGVIVFNDPEALSQLNTITHKYVGDEIERRIAEWETQGGKIAAIDAIALIESGRSKKCDVVIGVKAPVETRVKRIMKRDGMTREQAEDRINAQKPAEFYKENCDYLLEGTYGTPKEFKEKCIEFFTELLKGQSQ